MRSMDVMMKFSSWSSHHPRVDSTVGSAMPFESSFKGFACLINFIGAQRGKLVRRATES